MMTGQKRNNQKYIQWLNATMLPASQATRATELGTLSVPLNAFYSGNNHQAYPTKGGKIPTIRGHAPAKSLRSI